MIIVLIFSLFLSLFYSTEFLLLCVYFWFVYTSCIVFCMYLDPMEEQHCRNDKAEYVPSSRFYSLYTEINTTTILLLLLLLWHLNAIHIFRCFTVLVQIISFMPFTICPCEWFHILVKAIRIWRAQGSVGGPTLFSIYLTGLRNVSSSTSFCSLSFICRWHTNFCFISAKSNSSFPSPAQFRKMHRRYRRSDEVKFFAVKPQ